MTGDYQPGYGQYGVPPEQTTPPAPSQPAEPRRRWVAPTIVGVAALLLGVGIGTAGGSDTEPTATVETVAEVPAVCLQALGSAEELMSISSDFAGITADYPPMIAEAAQAGMAYDVAAIEDLTARMHESTARIEELTGRAESSPYRGQAADCRSAAGERGGTRPTAGTGPVREGMRMKIAKRIVGAVGALTVAGMAALMLGTPAQAEDPPTFEGSVTGSPDNDPPDTAACDTWARSDFTRVTTVTKAGDKYQVRQEIDGTWVSTTDPDIEGTLIGFVEYEVSGAPLRAQAHNVDDEVDLSGVACKSQAPAGDRAGNWALRYFETGAEAGPITGWEYVYDTACEDEFVENAGSASVGAGTFTEVCPEPTPTATADPSPTASPSPSPSPEETEPAASGEGGSDKDGLPVTGNSWVWPAVGLGGSAVIVGGFVLYALRRKKTTFVAE